MAGDGELRALPGERTTQAARRRGGGDSGPRPVHQRLRERRLGNWAGLGEVLGGLSVRERCRGVISALRECAGAQLWCAVRVPSAWDHLSSTRTVQRRILSTTIHGAHVGR